MAANGGVRILSPEGAIKPTGTWSLGARAGDFVFVAGMRGIDPATDALVAGPEQRITTSISEHAVIANSEGASLANCVRLTVFVTDMAALRPLVNKVQEELWAGWPYPPRTIVEVAKLNQDEFSRWKAPFTPRKQRDLRPIPSWGSGRICATYIGKRSGWPRGAAQKD